MAAPSLVNPPFPVLHVQVQGRGREAVEKVANALGLSDFIPHSYIEQVQLGKLTDEFIAVTDDVRQRFSVNGNSVLDEILAAAGSSPPGPEGLVGSWGGHGSRRSHLLRPSSRARTMGLPIPMSSSAPVTPLAPIHGSNGTGLPSPWGGRGGAAASRGGEVGRALSGRSGDGDDNFNAGDGSNGLGTVQEQQQVGWRKEGGAAGDAVAAGSEQDKVSTALAIPRNKSSSSISGSGKVNGLLSQQLRGSPMEGLGDREPAGATPPGVGGSVGVGMGAASSAAASSSGGEEVEEMSTAGAAGGFNGASFINSNSGGSSSGMGRARSRHGSTAGGYGSRGGVGGGGGQGGVPAAVAAQLEVLSEGVKRNSGLQLQMEAMSHQYRQVNEQLAGLTAAMQQLTEQLAQQQVQQPGGGSEAAAVGAVAYQRGQREGLLSMDGVMKELSSSYIAVGVVSGLCLGVALGMVVARRG